MIPVFTMTVYGSPISQPRQRHRKIKTNAGQEFVQNYTERGHPVQQWKADIKQAALAVGLLAALLEGPVALECRFYLPRPKGLMRKKDPPGPVWHTKKPDIDNLYKAVQDALAKVLWHDDNQVVSFGPRHGKYYAEKDGRPRLELALYDLSGTQGAVS